MEQANSSLPAISPRILDSRLRRFEDTIRNQNSQPLVMLGWDSRVPQVRNIEVTPNTVVTNLNFTLGAATWDCTLRWINPGDPRVDHYEIWAKIGTNNEPVRLSAHAQSPARLNFAVTIASVVVLYVVTVLKDGKRNNTNSAPTATVSVTV